MDDPLQDSAQAEHGSLLLRQLERMRAAEELTDVVLLAEGVPFSCHKVVLSAFSPYFQVKMSCIVNKIDCAHMGKYKINCEPLCPGHVYMWSEGDPGRRGTSERHTCPQPGAATGLHVPS